MPRLLCVGNGNLLISYDGNLNIRDLYYPYVGMENNVGGHFCRIGVWSDGFFSWIDNKWTTKLRYIEDALVTDAVLTNDSMELELNIRDTAHQFHDFLLRQVRIKNQSSKQKEVRLFFSHDLHVGGADNGITALYYPLLDAIIHYREDTYFLVSGMTDTQGLFEFAVGKAEFENWEGTWKDAEDGILSNNLVAHGSVDSTVSLRVEIPSGSERTVYLWLAAGRSLDEVKALHNLIKAEKPQKLIDAATVYFKTWSAKSDVNFGNLPVNIVNAFKRSLLILRTQIDNRGGIVASSDSDLLRFNKDTYNYVWPRDGAFVSMGIDAAGYFQITQRFFGFCGKAISPEGFLYQKYHPDGSWGSTWHPWSNLSRQSQLPIQEDETALVIFSLWNHYYQARDMEFIAPLYEPLICKAADFLVSFRDPKTNLPMPSYDLWEENFGVSTFTTSTVYAGLKAASKFARLFGDDRSEKYDLAAEQVKEALLKHLYNEKEGRFVKMLKPIEGGGFSPDLTVDSSMYGVFEFGVLPADDPRVEKTMNQIESTLWVKTDVGGVARYTNDYYQRVSQDFENVPGNPWFICTLWLAEWYIAKNQLDKALKLMTWVVDHATEAGLLAEQINPYNGEPLSVSPLTWSHSTFALTIIEYLNKLNELKVCEKCGLPIYRRRKPRLWQ
jgi:oligosaccharide amylase